MAEHTNETTIANLREALVKVIAERDELRALVDLSWQYVEARSTSVSAGAKFKTPADAMYSHNQKKGEAST